jgi:L-threonylcarbamoyladenylate synthase
LVLDGGPCKVGIESTVVSIVDGNVKLLRLGIISKKALEEVLGQSVQQPDDHELKASPGQHPKHYSPRARVRLVDVLEHAASGLTFGTPQSAEQIQMPSSESDYAAKLYAALSHFDWLGVKEIQVERPPIGWVAIWDRLNRASAEDPAE